ncbi:FAD-binding protein [Arthrobacter sp. efr-133-R2A-120]|uniref:FAD-binding oxidoreductase n=1 Tax=Arthrobacter sp. efr-133-R2A-120 TaxID=3040277 RepID=UPI00254A19DE|nr:FAD-binding protein [Arthrobacter sp. efr-133-R2A-120]
MSTTASRRTFLGAGGALAGAFALSSIAAGANAAPSGSPRTPYRVITPGSEQYEDLLQGTNLRWKGAAQRIAFPTTTDEVAQELRTVLGLGLRPSARSGGHCYEGFIANGDVKAIIDLSAMDQVRWDPAMGAFEIGAGAQLGLVYQLLYKQWGVYAPAGNCPTVGAGGHIAGGGYGSMNRRDGLVVDHLLAVESVHVQADGTVAVSRGTRDPRDPHHELWWAHAGGGGGNFGIATRYWLRSPSATGEQPEKALPAPPRHVWLSTVAWDWASIDEAAFTRLLNNHGRWHEVNSAPGAPEANLFAQLKTWHRSGGSITMDTIVDGATPDATGVLDRYLAAVSAGIPAPKVVQHRLVPWLQATQWSGFTGPDSTRRFKGKSAYLRRSYTADAIAAAYRGLNDPAIANPTALLMIASYGGAVNQVSAAATAVPQRDSIIKFQVVSIWDNPEDDDANVAWTRTTYRNMFAATGGVPAPNENADGAFVNYADVDLNDRAWNTSGLSAFQLYYKDNLPRLKRARATYDPKGVFTHAQSIPLA